jgi:hypothetical protein
MSRYDPTDFEWRVIKPLLQEQPALEALLQQEALPRAQSNRAVLLQEEALPPRRHTP